MKTFLILWARELGVWFHAASTYVMLAVFTAVTGVVFWKVTEESIGEPYDPAMLLFGPLYLWLMIVLLVAVVAMRLFLDDRRTGRLEIILTAPVTDWQIVLAKYAGAVVVFAAACLPMAAYPLIIEMLRGNGGETVGLLTAPVITGFLALFLCGAFFNGIGVLCAAVFKGPVSTVVGVFVACSLFFVAEHAGAAVGNAYAAGALDYLAMTPALRDFTGGIVDARPIVLWCSTIVFCLFAAQRTLSLYRVTRRY